LKRAPGDTFNLWPVEGLTKVGKEYEWNDRNPNRIRLCRHIHMRFGGIDRGASASRPRPHRCRRIRGIGQAEPLDGLAVRGRGVIDWRFRLVLPGQNARNVGSPFALQNLIGT
jgi:hypothetical protein